MTDEAPRVDLPARFLFRFAVPCRYHAGLKRGAAVDLGPEYALPDLSALEGQPGWADVRAGWSEHGLGLVITTRGKKRPAYCQPSRMNESDGLRVWINTRHNAEVRRGTRFCHQFAILPFGRGKKNAEPVVGQLVLGRAREQAPTATEGLVAAESSLHGQNYRLAVFFDAAALNGWAPKDVGRIGFTYRLWDHEFGEQALSNTEEMPIAEDPSLWAVLEFVK
jgi:hypothetical protein